MSETVEDQRDGQFELKRACCGCGNIPCVWEANVESSRHEMKYWNGPFPKSGEPNLTKRWMCPNAIH
jgi:hypothetical protein